MLGIRNYTQDYIDDRRAKIDTDLASYRKLAAITQVKAFETTFFNNMVIVLDHLFVHRLRTVEGKDGNPLNEARMLGDSIMESNRKFDVDKSIKFDPAKSVLKYKVGDEITLTEADFVRLSDAFFAEIESKFVEVPVSG